MSHEIFYSFLNILGLNYSKSKLSIKFVFCVKILVIFAQIIHHVIAFKKNHKFKDLYFYLDNYQAFVPFLMDLIFTYRAIKFEIIEKNKIPIKIIKIDQFIGITLIILTARAIKIYYCKNNLFDVYQHLSMLFAELTFSCNDLLFATYVNNLAYKLKHDSNFKETMVTLNIKRSLMQRYSCEIFCTVSYNFGIMILNFYWVFMRISFGKLNKLKGENIKIISILIILFYFVLDFITFVYFPQPLLCIWVVYSSCENFINTVWN